MISDEEFCLFSSSEATVFSGIYWMHGRYDLCFYGASQLFPLCDLLSPSGMSLRMNCLCLFKSCSNVEVSCFSALGVLSVYDTSITCC